MHRDGFAAPAPAVLLGELVGASAFGPAMFGASRVRDAADPSVVERRPRDIRAAIVTAPMRKTADPSRDGPRISPATTTAPMAGLIIPAA